MIKIVITEKCLDSKCLVKQTTKEEVLKCSDGYDGTKLLGTIRTILLCRLVSIYYCRYFARNLDPFKTLGMVCLNEKGVWEEQ